MRRRRLHAAGPEDATERQLDAVLQRDQRGEQVGARADRRAEAIDRMGGGGDVEMPVVRRHRPAIERRDPVADGYQPLWQKRELQVESGGADDEVVGPGAAVDKLDPVAVE